MPAGRPREFDKDEVLERAMCLFWRRGYHAVGLTELLQHMGIARQSLYDTYGNKRQLFLAAVERYYETRLRPVEAILAGPGSPSANIQAAIDFFRMTVASGSNGCLVANSLVEFAAHDAGVCLILRSHMARLEQALCDCLERAQELGEVARTCSARQMSRMLLTAMLGLAVKGKMGLEASVLDEVSRGTKQLLAVS